MTTPETGVSPPDSGKLGYDLSLQGNLGGSEGGEATSHNAVVLTSENGTDWTVAEVGGPSVLNEEAGYYESTRDNPSA